MTNIAENKTGVTNIVIIPMDDDDSVCARNERDPKQKNLRH